MVTLYTVCFFITDEDENVAGIVEEGVEGEELSGDEDEELIDPNDRRAVRRAERDAIREARAEEIRSRQAKQEAQKAKDDARAAVRAKKQAEREAAEAEKAEEERKKQEEELKKQEEEFNQWKDMFTVSGEGSAEAEMAEQSQGLLQDFLDYIKVITTCIVLLLAPTSLFSAVLCCTLAVVLYLFMFTKPMLFCLFVDCCFDVCRVVKLLY